MANEVYEFLTALKGYHCCKHIGILFAIRHFTVHMKLGTVLISSLLKCIKMMEKLWGICPLNFRESRNSYWTEVKRCKNIDRTFDRTRSPLMQGGFEIPCNMAFAMDIRTKG